MVGNVREMLWFSVPEKQELQSISPPNTEKAKDQQYRSAKIKVVKTLELILMILSSSHLNKRTHSLIVSNLFHKR